MLNFINDTKKQYIHNFLKNNILTNLNYTEFNLIIYHLTILIEFISVRFSIRPRDYDIFWNQLVQNNHRDIIAMFNLLLPYIDDKEGKYSLHKEIYELKDISDKKINENQFDQSINNYLITNTKYNLYYDDENNIDQQYNTKLFKQNFCLLLATIDQISNKLFVNWLNIVPLSILSYKSSYLFENSFRLSTQNENKYLITLNLNIEPYENIRIPFNISNPHYIVNNDENTGKDFFNDKLEYKIISDDKTDPYIFNEKILDYKGISLNDIFNTLYYDLFLDVIKLKWLIYQDTFEDPNKDIIYIKKFNDLIAIPGLYLNKKWTELSSNEQIIFASKWEIFLTKVLSNQNLKRNSYFHMLKSIIIFFEKNYDMKNVIKNGYEKITTDSNLNIIDDDDNDNFDDNDNTITEIDLIMRIRKIPNEDLYSYLLETIQRFMQTWYGKNIIRHYDPLNPNDINKSTEGESINGLDKIIFVYTSYASSNSSRIQYDLFTIVSQKIIPNLNIDLPESFEIKYKFFYNYAKAFFLVYIDKEIIQRQNYKHMEYDNQKRLLNFLNMSYSEAKYTQINKNNSKYEHFNVMSFIKYYNRTYSNYPTKVNGQYSIFNNSNPREKNMPFENLFEIVSNLMFYFIRKILPEIVFESHIIKGILNEFMPPNPYLTDNNYLGTSYEEKKTNQFENLKKYVFSPEKKDDYLNNSYYFLTGKPYYYLNEIHRNNEKKSYFDLITSDYRWYSFYSMDWVAQINFFHRYINNRVIYITGATGQGKSTQIPKLFLYSLLMLDRNPNGKVICSQPRTAPTRENSDQISYELGLPIMETSANNKQKIKTFNSYIQYQSQADSHIVNKHNGLMLKVVTDRLLYMGLMKSPIYKDIENPDQNSNSESYDGVEFNVYKKENTFDIIMVDESHEHNINMDLILTFVRDTVKYNNSLKLVIVSATMAEDEPIYRRYYREIDDNFSYPYSSFNYRSSFDRYSVDRRIHISPPGETTQHKVTDRYLDFEPKDYSEAETLGIKQVIKIATDSNSKGDILFFSLSTEDIKRVCKTINDELPSNSDIICLPYFSELPSKWDIFNDLSKKVKLITVNRTELYDEIYPNINIITKKVVPGTYKRAIVVATNIAEASLTIASLKYVIDTGYFISVEDNPYILEPIINKSKISESSRIQRRGRVGRVSSGIVYYMYKKNSRRNIKPKFKICIENISGELLELMPNKYDDKPLIPHIKWFELIGQNISKNFSEIYENAKHFNDSNILKNLLQQHYTTHNLFNLCVLNFMTKNNTKNTKKKTSDTSYYEKLINFDPKKTISLYSDRTNRLISGYEIKNYIYDILGNFFIIHPEENNIKRDILTGKIIQIEKYGNITINTKSENILISHRIFLYIRSCFFDNLLINHNNEIIPLKVFEDNNDKEFFNYKFHYEKSTIGRIILKSLSKLEFNKSKTMNKSILATLIYAYVCDIDDIVLIMITLLHYSEYQLSGLNKNYEIYGKLYGNDDLFIYYKIAENIFKKINILLNNNQSQFEIIFNNKKKEYLAQKQTILNNINNKLNYWNLDISINNYKTFNLLDNQNKLDANINDYQKENAKYLSENTIKSFMDILSEQSIQIDYNSANKLLKYYIDNKCELDRLKNIYKKKTDKNVLLWFKYNMPIKPHTDKYTCVKNSFIHGFGVTQTVMYYPPNNNFIDINLPNKQFKSSSATLTKISDTSVYLFINTLKKEISIIINADIETIVECNLYGFNPSNFQDILQYNNIELSNINSMILNKILQITLNKKYISHLRTNIVKHKDLDDKLLKYNNNFTEYLIKLWTSDTKSNIYNIFPNAINKSYNNLIGGNNINLKNKTIKFNLSKIGKILTKLNISFIDFVKILIKLINNGQQIELKENYLYIKN